MNENFGEVIKRIRKEKHMTLEKMAELLGTTKQALSRYERNQRTPKITAAIRFAEVLGVPLETMMGYEYHESEPIDFEAIEQELDKVPQTPEARILAKGIDQLSPEQRAQALAVVKAMFAQHPELFND